MKFQLSYFKSQKMMLLKRRTQHVSKFGKFSSGHRTGKGKFSFQSQRRAISKNVQTTTQLRSFHMLARSDQISRSVMSDSLQLHEPQHARPPRPSPTPGVHQTHDHRVSDATQPSHPLLSPSPPAPNASQHQSLF